ncbi:MAG TPA: hypothetical protein VGH38_36750 [Bryobacteraceae bacterium]
MASSLQKRAFDWSADGKSLLYTVLDPKTKFDLLVLPLEEVAKPVPFLTGPYNETQGQFAPGPGGTPQWIAYSSDESGHYEIYVQSFPRLRGPSAFPPLGAKSRGGDATARSSTTWDRTGKSWP